MAAKDSFDPAEFTEAAQHDPSMLDDLTEAQYRALDEYLQDPEIPGSVHIRGRVAHQVNAFNIEANSGESDN